MSKTFIIQPRHRVVPRRHNKMLTVKAHAVNNILTSIKKLLDDSCSNNLSDGVLRHEDLFYCVLKARCVGAEMDSTVALACRLDDNGPSFYFLGEGDSLCGRTTSSLLASAQAGFAEFFVHQVPVNAAR
jgi:hypothetical protein